MTDFAVPLPTRQRQIVLAARPNGLPVPGDFRLQHAAIPVPDEGGVLLQHSHLGLAPAARTRMGTTASYVPPMELGEVVFGQSLGVVVRSRNPDFRPGDMAMSMLGGWQEYSVAPPPALTRVDPAVAPPTAWLGVLGTSGLTAYVGLLDFGQPRPGETVVVSAASGGVGSAVGQIARILGCRVVGIAGGAEKCRFVVDALGFDACIDHRAPDAAQALREACPDGVDIYFDNVGGAVRDAVWPCMAQGGRVVVCGLISEYNRAPQPGPDWFTIISRRLSLRGFIVSDHLERKADFLRDVGQWVREGRVHFRECIYQGLEQAVPAFIAMLQGNHLGKTLVRL
jgi:NADPH-dependent curcumin reductase CurA